MSRADPVGVGYDPNVLRAVVDAYRSMLRELNAIRARSDSVAELLAIATVTEEIQGKLGNCQRRLDRVECQRHTQARRAAAGRAQVQA